MVKYSITFHNQDGFNKFQEFLNSLKLEYNVEKCEEDRILF